MSIIPRNVQKMLHETQTLEAASAYSQQLKTGSVKAEWFEKDFQRLQSLQSTMPKRSGRVDTQQERRDAGLRTGVEAVKLVRQERLKELFEAEALKYEAELQSLGLSLVKPRD